MKTNKNIIVFVILVMFSIISCGKNSSDSTGAGGPGDSGSIAPEAIAVWAFPDGVSIPYRDDNNDIIAENINIGVVAYHSTGIDQIEFTVNGSTTYVTNETVNPKTGEYEYVLNLDPTTLAVDGEYTISAVAYPNSGTIRSLPALKIQKDTASHNILYVGAGGYSTIDAACQAAEGGDIIKVQAGTYALPDQTGYSFTKYSTIMPDGNDNVEIMSGSLRSSYIKFKNVTFNLTSSAIDAIISSQHTHFWFDGCTSIGFGKDAADNNASAFRFYNSSEYAVIENCIIHDASLGATLSAGNYIVRHNHVYDVTADGFGYNGSNFLITNNTIHNNHLPPGGDQHCDFISSNEGANQVILRNNTCYNGHHQGLKMGAYHDFRSQPYSNIAIVNNLLAKVADSAVNIQLLNTGQTYDNILIEHNTVWNGSNVFLIRDDYNFTYPAIISNITVRNNIFGPNTVASYSYTEDKAVLDYNCFNIGNPSGPNSVTGNPLFENEVNWNFVLQGSSPAKNRGNYFSNIKYDINWNPRNLTNPSMGAYE